MKHTEVYVGRDLGEHLEHAKYIKKVMGSNGKWRYIYDTKELKKDIRVGKSRLKTKAQAKIASTKAKIDYKTGKSFKQNADYAREMSKIHKDNARQTKKYLSKDSPAVLKEQKAFIKKQKKLAAAEDRAVKRYTEQYNKSLYGRVDNAKKKVKRIFKR